MWVGAYLVGCGQLLCFFAFALSTFSSVPEGVHCFYSGPVCKQRPIAELGSISNPHDGLTAGSVATGDCRNGVSGSKALAHRADNFVIQALGSA